MTHLEVHHRRTAPSSPPAPCAFVTYGALAHRLSLAADSLWRDAPALDADGSDPAALCRPLAEQNLFVDSLPVSEGGAGLATDAKAVDQLVNVLQVIGAANLSAGRILEGHVNALKLVFRYGAPAVRASVAADVRAGQVCGVWNAERPPGLRIAASLGPDTSGGLLSGRKIFASGIGLVTRPIVTARTDANGLWMAAPRLPAETPFDLSGWKPRGMLASATGTIDLTGVAVAPEDIVGKAEDYYRSPVFKSGAWRFAAVQTGAVLKLVQLMQSQLTALNRAEVPQQKARLAAAAAAAQTATLWVNAAARLAEDARADPERADAFVNLCRTTVQRAALDVVGLAEHSLGLTAFLRPDPIDRIIRDLTTYLRQPFADAVVEDAAGYLLTHEPSDAWLAIMEGAL